MWGWGNKWRLSCLEDSSPLLEKFKETFKTRQIFKSEQLERLIELRRRWNSEDEVCFKKICFL